jgi:KR domain
MFKILSTNTISLKQCIKGGFTPLGLTLIHNLAQRGAHIIALSPDPIDSPKVTILVSLLRSNTSNEKIFAEQCDLSSPSSVRSFCTCFLTSQDQRLDGIVFAHEHGHIGIPGFLVTRNEALEEKERETGSLATFLITTLLLPALLVAPPERDIRIVNVVNPFYAAAASIPFRPSFSTSSPSSSPTSSPEPKPIFLQEGIRSLRTIIFARHLQRILDALPSAAQVPKTQEGSRAVPVVNSKLQKSNIIAVSVSPGIGRVDTVSRILNADWTGTERKTSWLGIFL